MAEEALYKLNQIVDNPRFKGFAFVRDESLRGKGSLTSDFSPDDVKEKGRSWTVTRMAPTWEPQPVIGRVRPQNDYPCVNLTIPAFSRKAVDALRDFLEPNGELLPLVSSVGEYYAYNVTSVVDILDLDRSDIQWFSGPRVLAIHIRRYECLPGRLEGLSIFRIVEDSATPYVTQVFVDRVKENGLQGFDVLKLWPHDGE